MDRRKFLKTGGVFLVGAPGAYGLYTLGAGNSCAASTARSSSAAGASSGCRWGMVIDLTRCPPDCDACLHACRRENNVAFHNDERYDIHWIRKVKIRSKDPEQAGEKAVPLLCNHCEHPPCVQVCPIRATYKRADGIVIVDHHRCMGCRYCMIACPYNARYFNYKENHDWPNKNFPKRSHGVAESCNLCAHLLDQGRPPACVAACRQVQANALMVGDLNDPESDVSRLVAQHPVKRIREDFGTEPNVYYIGL